MLALSPQSVRMEKAQHFISASQERAKLNPILGNGVTAKLGWHMRDYNSDGAAGNAKAASVEKGRALLDAAATQLAALLSEISRLPLSTIA
jgi:creatinine amidohydrolase